MIYTTPWKTLQTLLGTISRLGRPLPSVNPSGKKFNIYIYFFFLHILIPPINSHYYLKKKKKLEKGFAKRVTLCVSPESHLSSVRESNRDGRQMKPKIRVFPDTISVPPICTRESHFRPVWIETATGRSLPPSLNQYSYQVSNQQHVNEKSRGSTRYSLSNITHFT